MSTVQVSDDEFESSVLEADGPVLVDFWAEWCGPCKMIGPALEEIADNLSDQLTVAKLRFQLCFSARKTRSLLSRRSVATGTDATIASFDTTV